MALSSCSSFSHEPVKNANGADLMLEDTVAHEDLFGAAKLPPKMLGIPDETPASGPKVGVQFTNYEKESVTYYAVRYVAAIGGLEDGAVTAEWTRAVSDDTGVLVKSFGGGKMSTVEYDTLNNGSTPTDAVDEGTGYNKYIVYSLYDIPASQINSYIMAYLTLSKAGEPDVVSKAVAARIGGGNAFSFAADKAEGYFLQGKINGTPNTILNLDDSITEATDHAEKRDVSLKEDDEFGCFYYNPDTSFKFFGYDMNIGDSVFDYYVEQSASSKYMKLRANATYDLTMSDEDLLAISDPDNPTVTLYFHPGTNWRNGSPKYSIWYYLRGYHAVSVPAGSRYQRRAVLRTAYLRYELSWAAFSNHTLAAG